MLWVGWTGCVNLGMCAWWVGCLSSKADEAECGFRWTGQGQSLLQVLVGKLEPD